MTLALLRRSALLTALVIGAIAPSATAEGELDAYIRRAEPKATWKLEKSERVGGVEHSRLSMVSQTWQGIDFKHELHVTRPLEGGVPDMALVLVTGGSGRRSRAYGETLVAASGLTVAILDSIPNQPLFGKLREDGLIAHTFVKYMETDDVTWPLLFPMTKSVIKAMDVLQAHSAKAWPKKLERFVITGASKRGWTTWLAGASDDRVKGIIPIVFDNLNFEVQMKHQIDTWGKYSNKIGDYTERGLQQLITTPKGKKLAAMVDPYAYRERLAKMPKLIVNGTNDKYWTIDALTKYWDGMGSNKAVMYAPNSGHSMPDIGRVLGCASAFLKRLAVGRRLPQVRWDWTQKSGRAGVAARVDERPRAARAWIATSKTGDFRDSEWIATKLELDADGGARHLVTPSGETQHALFIEYDFGDGGDRFQLSTGVRIIKAKARVKAKLY
jgi:PhoPQ-activated pathogenicity-related protein